MIEDLDKFTITSLERTYILAIFAPGQKELLRIDKDGNVIAPDLESATLAGKMFVESIRTYILKMLGEQNE